MEYEIKCTDFMKDILHRGKKLKAIIRVHLKTLHKHEDGI